MTQNRSAFLTSPGIHAWLRSIGLLVLIFSFSAGQVRAEDEPSAEKQDRSLDDELLKSLGEDEEDAAGSGDKPAKGEAGEDSRELDDELMRGLDDGEDIGEENPLVKVGRQMREAEELIVGEKTGEETQELQKEIVEQLKKLLEQAQQQQQQQQASKSQNQDKKSKSQRRQAKQPQQQKNQQTKKSEKPARDSTEKLGPDKMVSPDKLAVSDLIKRVWGQLPEKDREQMSQHSIELFLPQYEQLITEYFKALIEKQK